MHSTLSAPARKAQDAGSQRPTPFDLPAWVSEILDDPVCRDARLARLDELIEMRERLRSLGLDVLVPPTATMRGRPRVRTPEHFQLLLVTAIESIREKPSAGMKVVAGMVAAATATSMQTVRHDLRCAWRRAGYQSWREFRGAILRACNIREVS